MTTKTPSLLRFWSRGGNYDPDRIEYDKQLVSDLAVSCFRNCFLSWL